jgi:hypothetical protein
VKGFSAREANKALNRTREPFWQTESYDHISYCTPLWACLTWCPLRSSGPGGW